MYINGKNTPLIAGDIITKHDDQGDSYLISASRGCEGLYFSFFGADDKFLVAEGMIFFQMCSIMADSSCCGIHFLDDNHAELVAK